MANKETRPMITRRLSEYRVEAGVYDVGNYRIYQQGAKCWSVRCPADSILDWFPTLRAAIKYAEWLDQGAEF